MVAQKLKGDLTWYHFQRNHSTVYWAVRLVTTRMARDTGFRHAIEKMERELTSTTATVAAAAYR
jgi:hypothetical protein